MSLLTSSLEALANHLGMSPESELLHVALTHSSYAAEHDCVSNERLEFLGDAVVDLAIADLITREYPELNEGTGSLVRSRVVNEASLASLARRLDLGSCIKVGKGEIKSGGTERDSLLADAFEAVVAALYLENGFQSSCDFVQAMLADEVADASLAPDEVDPKTQLRQWSEQQGHGTPTYEVSGSGPLHATTFEATVRVGTSLVASGHGRSKKSAESQAAKAALERRSNA